MRSRTCAAALTVFRSRWFQYPGLQREARRRSRVHHFYPPASTRYFYPISLLVETLEVPLKSQLDYSVSASGELQWRFQRNERRGYSLSKLAAHHIDREFLAFASIFTTHLEVSHPYRLRFTCAQRFYPFACQVASRIHFGALE